MANEASSIIPIVSVVVTGLLGIATVWLALRHRASDDSLDKATRRTAALQLLSDEEFALIRVRDECVLFDNTMASNKDKLGDNFQHFRSEASRIIGEAERLLDEVQGKRRVVEPQIEMMSAAEIERVIAAAYHGKVLAEAQLQRTLVSKSAAFRTYGL